MGAWTLLDGNTLLGSALCSSPFPGGVIQFQENRAEPPSRAYLKLWEAFTLAGRRPGPGERCLDAGASPGGWTWVIARLGAEVVAVDRAPLAPGAAGLPGVRFLRHDAFTLRMRDLEPVDWVFSDVACYPPKLLAWVTAWLEAGYRGNFICTIKMQGNADLESTRRFSALGGRVLHLWHNKHELTWIFISH
jgi:23S rRNA (cytidine2498-2'-O)-methyltransferase